MGGQNGRRRALVIGAGVSGCACGATLAAAGMRVTVLGAALDRAALPRYGPVLASGREAVVAAERVLGELPPELGEAWWRAAFRSEDGCLLAVDRRLVSIECKRALEDMGGLEFRQGVACDLRVRGKDPARASDKTHPVLEVSTVFGEVLEAEAVIVSVGLELCRDTAESEGEQRGGWSGGSWRQGLKEALEGLGAVFVVGRAEVGRRYGSGKLGRDIDAGMKVMLGVARGAALVDELTLAKVSRVVSEGGESRTRGVGDQGVGTLHSKEASGERISEYWPESPYEDDELWAAEVLVAKEESGSLLTVACADGVATGEISVALGWGDDGGTTGESEEEFWSGGLALSRQGRTKEGLTIEGLDEHGRLQGASGGMGPVWVIGRAGGAGDYVESLASGTRAGLSILESLR